MPIIDNIIVRFYVHPEPQAFQSEKLGRPIFLDVEYIEKQPVGDQKSRFGRPVRPEDIAQYPEAYREFKERGIEREHIVGTLLEAWSRVTPAQIEMFKHFKVYTVEHVAGLDALACQNIGMGTTGLVIEAQAYLDTAANNAPAQHMAAENERLKTELELQGKTVAELAAKLDELLAGKQDKPAPGPAKRGKSTAEPEHASQ